MDDLISRQAAIDAILHLTNQDSVRGQYEFVKKHGLEETWSGGIVDAIDAVIAVPSAQPEKRTQERTETHSCDLISRQVAIEAINHICPVDTEYDCTLLDRVDVRCVLSDLPSAQPKSEERTAESAQNVPKEDLISRKAAIDAVKGLPTWWADAGGYYGGAQPPMTALLDPEDTVAAIDNLPSAQPNLDRTKISDLLEKIYSIQSVHLSVEGVLARKYYCKQLWIELFGSEDVPKWID